MSWRWIIRAIFIGLLGLSVGGWISSYYKRTWVYYGARSVGSVQGEVALAWGKINIDVGRYDEGPYVRPPPVGWVFGVETIYYDYYGGRTYVPRFLGFGFSLRYGKFTVPFWFLTLLSGGGVWVVWRKTRRVEFRGFPVEMTSGPR